MTNIGAGIGKSKGNRVSAIVSERSKSRSDTKSNSNPISNSKSKSKSDVEQAQDVLRLVADVHATTSNKQVRKHTGDALRSVVLATKGHTNYDENVKQNIFRNDKRMSETRLINEGNPFPETPVRLSIGYIGDVAIAIHPMKNYVAIVSQIWNGTGHWNLELLKYNNGESYDVFRHWKLNFLSNPPNFVVDPNSVMIQFSPNGKWLLVHNRQRDYNRKIFLIDLSSPSLEMYTHDMGYISIEGITFTEDSNKLICIYDDIYALNRSDRLTIIPNSSWKTAIKPREFPTLQTFDVYSIGKVKSYHIFSNKKHTFYIFEFDYDIYIFKFDMTNLVDTYHISNAPIFNLIVHPTLPYLILNTWKYGLVVLNLLKMPRHDIVLSDPVSYKDCLVFQRKYKKFGIDNNIDDTNDISEEYDSNIKTKSLSNKRNNTDDSRYGHPRTMSISNNGKYLMVCTYDKSIDIYKFGKDDLCYLIYQKRGNIYDAVFNFYGEYMYILQNVQPKNVDVNGDAGAGVVEWKINENASLKKSISLERVKLFDDIRLPIRSTIIAHPHGRFLITKYNLAPYVLPMEYDVYRYEGGRKKTRKIPTNKKQT